MVKETAFQVSANKPSKTPSDNGGDAAVIQPHGKRNGSDSTPDKHMPIGDPLRDSEVRYRRLFETAQDGILILDAKTGQITDANPFLENLLGYDHSELLGKTLWEIGPFRDVAASQKSFRRLQAREYVRYENLPLETRTHERRQVEFVSNVYVVDGVKVIQCNIRDITERKLVEDRVLQANEDLRSLVAGLQTREDVLREQATHDPLTGLFNRRYLDATLTRELSRSWRRGTCLSFAILDIDYFKRINDVFGHKAGDMVLSQCARVLSQRLRRSDVACRLGGEEFALVFPDSSLVDTRRRVEEICALIKSLDLRHDGQLLGITVSAGIAASPDHALTAPDLLRAADEALYTAKHAGRDQVSVCESPCERGDPGEIHNAALSRDDAPLPKD